MSLQRLATIAEVGSLAAALGAHGAVLAFCLAVTAAMRSAFRKAKIPGSQEALLWLYSYCFAAMVILTIPASRVLAASQYACVAARG